MERKIIETVKLAEKIVDEKDTQAAAESLEYFKRWLAYFQHERLVHLIVTSAFGIITVICIITAYIAFSLRICLLSAVFLIMCAAYIRHYYILENKTQRLYELIDRLYELDVKKV